MIIRQFVNSDRNKVSYLIRRCLNEINSEDYTADQVSFLCQEFTPGKVQARFVERSSYIAAQGDRILGCVTLKDNEIGSLFVNPSYNRQGIGSNLYSYAEKLAIQRGATVLWVNSSKTAVVFYKNMGYILQEKRRDAKGGTTYFMYKKL